MRTESSSKGNPQDANSEAKQTYNKYISSPYISFKIQQKNNYNLLYLNPGKMKYYV